MFIITTIEDNKMVIGNTFYITEDYSKAIRTLNRLNCVRNPRIIRALTLIHDEWRPKLFGICTINNSYLREVVFGVTDIESIPTSIKNG